MMMRITKIVLASALAAIVASAAPAMAKSSQATKSHAQAEETAPSDECQAYQQAPDGSWTKLPCQEPGASAQISHKPTSASAEAEAR